MAQEQFEQKQASVSDEELIETIETKLFTLCQTGKTITMSVPPKVNDFDMAVCELIKRFKNLKIKR